MSRSKEQSSDELDQPDLVEQSQKWNEEDEVIMQDAWERLVKMLRKSAAQHNSET